MNEIDITPKAETIVILGAPGSGKDTQVEFLVDALGYKEISSGELIRMRAQHDEGLRKSMEKGELVSNDVVDDEIISVFALLPDEQPVILNGYPRTLEQAQKLSIILKENNRRLDKVIYIKVDDKELIKRIGMRRVCKRCNHFTDNSFKLCPECDGELVTRKDDEPKSVKNRLELFHKETEPVIDFFGKNYDLCEVDGNPSIEEVKENIRKVL